MIRDAKEEDLDQLCDMARRFVEESNLPYTFSPELTRELLWDTICGEDNILLVDSHDDILAGAIMGYMERDFCVEYSAYITKMYVEKEFRGIIATKQLISAFEKRVGDACVIFASATAGIDERTEKLFVNLFKKSGYIVLGRIMVKNTV